MLKKYKTGLETFGMIGDKMLTNIHTMIVLVHIEKKSTYPYALLKKFKKSKHPMLNTIDKNEMYNILSSLEHRGYVRSKIILSGSKAQKVYSVTPKGDEIARSFRHAFISFIKSASTIMRDAFAE
ncbi:MAG: PadR family transcriptional regulator [Candidatus Micrarchaeota archaeon]|nr:PadR family transcriptional regulator [Candidatus Micrarchaeota archaeon]